ncbi:MAG: Ig-like domain-containing protein [Oscillospiraceae bacterium]
MYEFINWDTESDDYECELRLRQRHGFRRGRAAQVTSLVLKKTTTDTDLTELKLSISKVGTVHSSSVRAEFEAGRGGRDTTVTWESSNENVAAVENKVNTSTGKTSAVSPPRAWAPPSSPPTGALTASFALTISAFDSTELSVVNEKDSSYLYFTLKSDDTVAPTVQLTTKPKYDLTVLENVQWSSSNENVATVDEKGLVTITGIGSAVITATGTCV